MEETLYTRGRIQDSGENNKPIVNSKQKIDGVRFLDYDPESKVVTIRMDHSECPGFWAEIQITVEQFDKFIGRQ